MSSLPFPRKPLFILMLSALTASPASHAWTAAQAELPTDHSSVSGAIGSTSNSGMTNGETTTGEPDAEAMTVTGVRLHRISKGATNLPLSAQETPQSVSIIDREWLDAFAIDDINQVLRLATGVNVEAVETDRTYYNSRGFDIKSMQVDGIGLPFNWNVVGALDTALYEKVEVIRGANGLLTGTGNPSGTINYVRKRPKSDFAGEVEYTTGSWDKQRVEIDLATPLTENGTWASRVVAVKQTGESHLDLYQNDRTVLYGVIDGELGDNAVLTFGYTRQDNESDGVLWGALPMQYADGTQTDFDVDTSTSMEWTYWNTYSKTAFAELAYVLPGNWQFKTVLTHNEYDEPSELFYIYTSTGFQHDGTGLEGWPGKYDAYSERKMLDMTLSGQFIAWGQEHDLLIGLNAAESDNGYDGYPVALTGALPAFPGWTGNEVPRPDFGPAQEMSDWQDKLKRLYIVSKIVANEQLNFLVGASAINVETVGENFGETMARDEQEVSPYLGANYYFSETFNIYASYSDIYEPQSALKAGMQPLGAAVGKSYELGLKAMLFDNRLLGTLALFRAEQENYANAVGFDSTHGVTIYEGIDVNSEGFELEASGRITDEWKMLAGYTKLELENADGSEARTFVPRETFNLGTRYRPAVLQALEIGGTLRWQDAMYLTNNLGTIEQDAYALISLYASYDLSKNWELAVNVNNATDEKYLASLYWDQAFYGAPRNWSVSVSATF